MSDSLQPMNYRIPGSSVHGILPSRTLEYGATSSSRGSSQPKDQNHISYVSCISRQILYHQHHLGSPLPRTAYSSPIPLLPILPYGLTPCVEVCSSSRKPQAPLRCSQSQTTAQQGLCVKISTMSQLPGSPPPPLLLASRHHV